MLRPNPSTLVGASPNPGKQVAIEVGDRTFLRYPVKTRLVTPHDTSAVDFVVGYTKPLVSPGDIVFISEKVVAITQGRAYPIHSIRPSRLAAFLSRWVTKNPAGIGLSMPQTMQLAIEEVGVLRILFAALAAALTKPFGIKGLFYRIVGPQAAAIDGPVPYAIPPYNTYASKGPMDVDNIAQKISLQLGGIGVCIVDANDLGVAILGKSNKTLSTSFLQAVLRDNPLGQSDESTPIGIIREANNTDNFQIQNSNVK